MPIRVTGIILLSLLVLSGCSRTEVRLAEIPAPLVEPVQEPDVSELSTNGDLLELFLDYQLALRLCNGKLSSIGKAYGTK